MSAFDREWDEYPEDEHEHITGWCADCHDHCESITIDAGIGSYEYFGARGVHHDYCEVSPCCHAEVLDHFEEMEDA